MSNDSTKRATLIEQDPDVIQFLTGEEGDMNCYLKVRRYSDEQSGKMRIYLKCEPDFIDMQTLRDELDGQGLIKHVVSDQKNYLEITKNPHFLYEVLTRGLELKDGSRIFSLKLDGDEGKPVEAFNKFLEGKGRANDVVKENSSGRAGQSTRPQDKIDMAGSFRMDIPKR